MLRNNDNNIMKWPCERGSGGQILIDKAGVVDEPLSQPLD